MGKDRKTPLGKSKPQKRGTPFGLGAAHASVIQAKARQAVVDDVMNMTEADLDAMIAEQSKPENLPSWWYEDVRYDGDLIGSLNFAPGGKKRYNQKRRITS